MKKTKRERELHLIVKKLNEIEEIFTNDKTLERLVYSEEYNAYKKVLRRLKNNLDGEIYARKLHK